MDDILAQELDQQTALVVPTRSLANHLQERIAARYLQSRQRVWEAPRILVWSELLSLIWHSNQLTSLASGSAHTLISTNQSLLLWTRVIESSRRQEQELTLLNVQQTAKATLTSSQLMADWLIKESTLAQDHISDSKQFLRWRKEYQQRLDKSGLIDTPLLLRKLLELPEQAALSLPVSRLIWYGFDLTTPAQQRVVERLSTHGLNCQIQPLDNPGTERSFSRYIDDREQFYRVFERARSILQQNPEVAINIVIPDLQRRRGEVESIAHQVLYPNASPLEMQRNEAAYRLSLGRPLNEYPAIEIAMRGLMMLKSRLRVSDFSFLLRSSMFFFARDFPHASRRFEAWLTRHRFRTVSLEDLPALWAQCRTQGSSGLSTSVQRTDQEEGFAARLDSLINARDAMRTRIEANKQRQSGFAVLEYPQWAREFNDWLAELGWDAAAGVQPKSGEMPFSLHFQLQQRWQKLLEEFSGYAIVQSRVGLTTALEQFRQLLRNTIFLPRSAAAPILVSGLYEALGQQCDYCFVCGMSDEFPPAPRGDAFVPNQHLLAAGYPDASPQTSVEQAVRVMQSLEGCARAIEYSYADFGSGNEEVCRTATPLLFAEFAKLEKPEPQPRRVPETVVLDSYKDICGPAWPATKPVNGGTKIFVNQAQCAFKAFVTLRLGFTPEDEQDFGLDSLDRGNIVHGLLDALWARLGTQANLKKLDGAARAQLVNELIDDLLESPPDLPAEKITLMQQERPRLEALLLEWLTLEDQRPQGFSVVEREEQYRESEWAGIKFNFVLDRVDLTDDGRTVIIDYKTGIASRSGWQSERIREPQLPLYLLARNKIKAESAAGIAFGSLRRGEANWIELSETDIFRVENHFSRRWSEDWEVAQQQWPQQLDQLAADFLAGNAVVNPIDQQVCNYCDLAAVCRVSELTGHSSDMSSDVEGFDPAEGASHGK